MHETSLAAGLLRIITEEAQKHRVQRIVHIRLGLGLLACVEAHTLTACFELLAENSVAQGANIDVEITPLPCVCQQCQEQFSLVERHFVCPACGSTNIDFRGGHGCMLLGLEASAVNDS